MPDEAEREERHSMRLARQFCYLMKEYRERFFTCIAVHLESYLLHVSELDNIHDDKEIDQLELDWITCQRDYARNKTWADSRTNILEAMQFLRYMTNIKYLSLLYIYTLAT